MHMIERVEQSIQMIMEKAEKIGTEKKEWTLDELFKASDIVKDMAEALKDLSKASMHSMERY